MTIFSHPPGLAPIDLRPLPKILTYSTYRFRFRECMQRILECEDLSQLHELSPGYRLFTEAGRDQVTVFHQRFYEKANQFLALYGAFLNGYVRPLTAERIYYQAVPTFRVHLPGNVAVAEQHRDRDYGHQDGEVNWWLPLTDAFDSNTIQIEDRLVAVPYGGVLRFDGVNLRHGNLINTTGKTRVSVDFRVIDAREFKSTEATSVSANRTFRLGDYWEGPL